MILIASCTSTNKETASDTSEATTAIEENPAADGFNWEDSSPQAIKIADDVMTAMGGRKNWDDTRYLSWNFFGARKLYWDKWTGDVRIKYLREDMEAIVNINSNTGRVMKNGEEVTNADSLLIYVNRAKSAWINDSYWLVMPFKLKDSGVTLRYFGEGETEGGKAADIVQLTFEKIGLTPQNIYEVWIDTESKLVSQWAYYPDSSASEPRFVTPWDNYQEYGEILLSGNRGDYEIGDISVFDEVPAEIFENHEMLIASLR